MKRKTRSFFIALCTLAFGIMLITPVIYAADEITITGVIFSSEGIIRTTDRQEYTIEIDAMGVDMINEDRRKVEVRGVFEEKEGKKIIKVIEYRLVK